MNNKTFSFFANIGIRISGINVPSKVNTYGPITMKIYNNTDPYNSPVYLANYNFTFKSIAG